MFLSILLQWNSMVESIPMANIEFPALRPRLPPTTAQSETFIVRKNPAALEIGPPITSDYACRWLFYPYLKARKLPTKTIESYRVQQLTPRIATFACTDTRDDDTLDALGTSELRGYGFWALYCQDGVSLQIVKNYEGSPIFKAYCQFTQRQKALQRSALVYVPSGSTKCVVSDPMSSNSESVEMWATGENDVPVKLSHASIQPLADGGRHGERGVSRSEVSSILMPGQAESSYLGCAHVALDQPGSYLHMGLL